MLNSQNGFYSNVFLGDRQTFLPRQFRAQGKEDEHYNLFAASAKVEEFTVHLKVARTIIMYTHTSKQDFGVSHPANKSLRFTTLQIREMVKYCVNVTE